MTGYEHRLRVYLGEQPSGFAISPHLPLTPAGNHQLDLPHEYKYEHNSGNSPDMVAIRDGASLPHQKRCITTDFQRLRNELLPCGCVVIGETAVDVGVELLVGHAEISTE
jgi:hypothetical protein